MKKTQIRADKWTRLVEAGWLLTGFRQLLRSTQSLTSSTAASTNTTVPAAVLQR